ncbi:monosaccharide ABC transporter substrate-binding protein (CUT2 family) [Tamaricihabitans halophyticus]|uniref:Monosaccharide ABC transporter substrate-binding protein (CUT2 family) n=1 Tax=Tamaricihabitans halophyticus TaxID=1262583 RepID=A0A4R2QZ26_9PSEU|nr:sugar ABC transporter substrate-binding protein [Tamaricihabitans halophyticus]TCP54338.1 monosaccharide ABC transporter substrate-binding protein (CUT2 family) [Tamaricihabitans halophyticus]
MSCGSRTRWRGTRLPWVLAVCAALVLAGCTGPSAQQPVDDAGAAADSDAPLRVAVISHSTPGDAFWDVVKAGAEAAGEELGVGVEYSQNPDPAGQARLIGNAVAQGATGLVVSMANPDALRDAIANARKAGIPVVTINSGAEESKEFGAIGHVGQDERIAGEATGERLADGNRRNVLCVIHEAGNVGLNDRCGGARDGFGGNNFRNLQVDINNPADVEARITGSLQTDQNIDTVLTLNPQIAANAVNAVRSTGTDAKVATFDVNPDVLSAIKAGDVLFAVDQQQYQQGYLPIVMLKLYRDNGNTLGGGEQVLTGPGFVDSSNVDEVNKYASRGTR